MKFNFQEKLCTIRVSRKRLIASARSNYRQRERLEDSCALAMCEALVGLVFWIFDTDLHRCSQIFLVISLVVRFKSGI